MGEVRPSSLVLMSCAGCPASGLEAYGDSVEPHQGSSTASPGACGPSGPSHISARPPLGCGPQQPLWGRSVVPDLVTSHVSLASLSAQWGRTTMLLPAA